MRPLLKNFRFFILDVFWPIKKEEAKLFVLMGFTMFCILFNFGSLRSVKDALVVPSIGAEVISFLKLWLVLPSSVLFAFFYAKISNILKFEYIFYLILGVFLFFFVFFAYVIYPNQDFFHPSPEFIAAFSDSHPNFKWFIRISGKWSYALMYIFSELWSAVVINLMFWQFANHIFNTEKARRFYPILGMIGNMGLILAGSLLVNFSVYEEDSSGIVDKVIASEYIWQNVISVVVLSGVCAMGCFWIINRIIGASSPEPSFLKVDTEAKPKLSLKESIKLILGSKYIGHIVALVFCYGLLINILEGPWKAKVREAYPDTVDYASFMGKFNIWMGISSVLFMVIGSNVIRRLSWLTAAMITPVTFTVTGFMFFGFVIYSKYLGYEDSLVNPLYAAVFVGSVQNILSKSTKYSLFDSTKEIAYIPLSIELKTKGKAAVEIIGIKFGKSAGAFIQSTIFVFFPNSGFDSIAVYLLVVFFIFLVFWMKSVVSLNEEYLKEIEPK